MRDSAAGQGREYALSESIGFVLILAILIIALSLYTLSVVPVTGREDEISQMNYVEEQFSDYKLALDALWSSRLINTYSPDPALAVSPPISSMTLRLGTGSSRQEGPLSLSLFKPIPSSATVWIRSTGDTFDIDSSSSHDDKAALADFPLTVTSLEYRSHNYYWIQQWYSYALGGVSLSQDEGSINRISPLISVTQSSNNSIVVNIVPVQITATNRSYSINGPVRVDTVQWVRPAYNISKSAYRNNQWVNLTFASQDNATAAMWLNIFKDTATRENLPSSAYRTGSAYNPDAKRTTVFLYLSGPDPDPQQNLVSLYVHRAEFNVTFNSVVSEIT